MAAAAGAIAVPIPVPIALSPSLSPSPCPHPRDTLLAASTLLPASSLPPRCHHAVTAPVPAPRATCHPARGNGMEKSASIAAGPKNPPDGATHGPRALPEWGNRGTGLPAVSPCPQNWEMEGGTCAARGCHRARAAGGCRGWRGTRRSGDVIEPGTSPSSRPICRGAAAILGSGNLGLSAQAGRGSGQGHGWLVVASRTEPHACPQPRVAATDPNPPQDHGEQGWELGRGLGQRGPCGLGCPHPAPAASPCPRATWAGDSSGDGDPGGSPARQHARPQLAASKLIFAREGPRCHQQFMRLLRCDYPSKTALPGNSASRALGKRLGRRSRFRSLFEVTQCPLLFSSPFPFAFLTLTWPEGWATGRER